MDTYTSIALIVILILIWWLYNWVRSLDEYISAPKNIVLLDGDSPRTGENLFLNEPGYVAGHKYPGKGLFVNKEKIHNDIVWMPGLTQILKEKDLLDSAKTQVIPTL